jgi:hypothetical protein
MASGQNALKIGEGENKLGYDFKVEAGWNNDKLIIYLTNAANLATSGTGKWVFTVYPFENPPSSRKVTT